MSEYEQRELLKEAVALIGGWCEAIESVGTGWDDWDEYYKEARYKNRGTSPVLLAMIDLEVQRHKKIREELQK